MTAARLTEAEVAAYFKVGKSTVRRWRESGTLQHFRHGGVIRYAPEYIALFEADHFVDAAPAGFKPLRAMRGRR